MEKKLTYRDAGVDIDAGTESVKLIKDSVRATYRPEVLGDLGGFGGLFALQAAKYKEPVLVSGTDGVGTKLRLAFMLGKHDTVGQDAVAMCVNDILVQGAEPLFFLDYLAVGKLVPEQVAAVVKGVAAACKESGCALIGGETAEMAGFYADGEYDIAGFAVGVVEKADLIDGSKVATGDVLIGLPSSGYHSNGYSLLRKIFTDLDAVVDGKSIGEHLLTPTKIYVKPVLAALAVHRVHGLAHITGGGLPENLPRAYGKGLTAVVDTSTFPRPPLLGAILEHVQKDECYGTFNMGIGFILIAPASEADAILATLQTHGEAAHIIGEMQSGDTPLILR